MAWIRQETYLGPCHGNVEIKKDGNIITHINDQNVPVPTSFNESYIQKIVCRESLVERKYLDQCVSRTLVILVQLDFI